MTKREEYHLKFYKELIEGGEYYYVIDGSEGVGEFNRLSALTLLSSDANERLIEIVNNIQNNMPYDPDFLREYDEYYVLNISFNNPYFFFGGFQTIHMADMKVFLQEWLDFKNS